MDNLIGRTFTHHGLKGAKQTATVIAQSEPTGKRGKVLVTVRLDDGTEYKADARSIPAEIVFAAPETGPMFRKGDTDHYGDVRRMFSNSSNVRG